MWTGLKLLGGEYSSTIYVDFTSYVLALHAEFSGRGPNMTSVTFGTIPAFPTREKKTNKAQSAMAFFPQGSHV